MEKSDLDVDKQKKYDAMKKLYLDKSNFVVSDKQVLPSSHSAIIDSLENKLKEKHAKLKEINSKELLSDLNAKKQQLDDKTISKKQHIQKLRSDLQILQKEISHGIKELRVEVDQKTEELFSTNTQLSQLTAEENELLEKIQDAQKLRVSQEKELEGLRLERLNIVNKNRDTHKIQEQISEFRNRLEQINTDRSMLELEIKSQMNLLDEEHQKEREIISRITEHYKN